ncbi:MAG: DUF2905 domain-containing protein [Candidatus Omnitrophica bacterium]|nr:DUF2905 domain-containing protein [Candidatus Omnitrophota bacterium]
MNDWSAIGKMLLLVGGILAASGLLLLVAAKAKVFGNLPGDIVLRRDNFTLFIPLTSSLVISIVISLIWWLFSGRR